MQLLNDISCTVTSSVHDFFTHLQFPVLLYLVLKPVFYSGDRNTKPLNKLIKVKCLYI